MSVVSEHNSKEEGERHNSEGGRVSLLVIGDSVSVYNLLEEVGHVVRFNVRRGVVQRADIVLIL